MSDDPWACYDQLLVGRKAIAKACGEPERKISCLVAQGLRAWKAGDRGTWKCLMSDVMAYLREQRERHFKTMSSG